MRHRSRLARPNIWRFRNFKRLTCPSLCSPIAFRPRASSIHGRIVTVNAVGEADEFIQPLDRLWHT